MAGFQKNKPSKMNRMETTCSTNPILQTVQIWLVGKLVWLQEADKEKLRLALIALVASQRRCSPLCGPGQIAPSTADKWQIWTPSAELQGLAQLDHVLASPHQGFDGTGLFKQSLRPRGSFFLGCGGKQTFGQALKP